VIDFSINVNPLDARLRKASGEKGGRGLREISGPQLPQTQAGHFDSATEPSRILSSAETAPPI
jgi:hypothetical protein